MAPELLNIPAPASEVTWPAQLLQDTRPEDQQRTNSYGHSKPHARPSTSTDASLPRTITPNGKTAEQPEPHNSASQNSHASLMMNASKVPPMPLKTTNKEVTSVGSTAIEACSSQSSHPSQSVYCSDHTNPEDALHATQAVH